MAQRPTRVFHNVQEFEVAAEDATKSAMQSTVKFFADRLREMAIDHIYNNAYKTKWYQRTNWLNDDKAVEGYIYKNVK